MKEIKKYSKDSSCFLKSYAKINLTFEVLRKTENDLHEITGIFQTINLHDDIEFSSASSIKVNCSDKKISQESNLVFKAILKLKKIFNIQKEGVHVNISKNIPVSSGFGGGSSNAAITLMTLNKLWDLKLTTRELIEIGIQLGSDVPFFIIGGTAKISGVGEIVEKLPSMKITPIMLSFFNYAGFNKTKNMYQELTENHFSNGENTENLLKCLKNQDPVDDNNFYNVFNNIAEKSFPNISERFKDLSNITGSKSILCGAGPSIFSVIKKPNDVSGINLPFLNTSTCDN
ncbi:MAG: 4-(cytidine 5'-diphospho)-2-C-methyl-D-erythritol kinase [Chloroflexi bacterium]|nr:4-(cytidine 5'-diphospho)-2-C-methyl-D-erythritol kinase [Chloroflexota bacterium]|tara:strand:+ start:2701 stop:3564 length:864 start_codon:yes stop_codon:yes gene_type:complete